MSSIFFFFFNATATTEIYTLSLHDALPIWLDQNGDSFTATGMPTLALTSRTSASVSSSISAPLRPRSPRARSEEHTSELQSQSNLVCRLLLEKKKKKLRQYHNILMP